MFTVLCWRSVVRVAYLTHPSNLLNLLTAPPPHFDGQFCKTIVASFSAFRQAPLARSVIFEFAAFLLFELG